MDISFTSLTQFLNCSHGFALQRVLKKQTAERGFVSKDSIIKHHILAQKLSKEYGVPYTGDLQNATFKEVEVAKVYLNDFDHARVIGSSRVLGIEVEHKINLSDGNRIITKMDMILEDPESNTIEVLDWKTGRLSSSPEDDDQGYFYAWAIMDKYNVDEVKVTKYFVHYRDARSKVYVRSEVERFMSYIADISTMMTRLKENPEDAIPCVSSKCSSCKVQHHCSAGDTIISDPDELHNMITFLKERIKDIEGHLKHMASENNGSIELLDGSTWSFTASKSVSLKKGTISKLDLCRKLVADHPRAVMQSEGLEIKLNSELVSFAEKEYGVKFITKTTNRFSFNKSDEKEG